MRLRTAPPSSGAGPCRTAARAASVRGAAASAATATVQAAGVPGGHAEHPGRAILRHALFARGVNGGTGTADPLSRTSRQRGQRASAATAFLSSHW